MTGYRKLAHESFASETFSSKIFSSIVEWDLFCKYGAPACRGNLLLYGSYFYGDRNIGSL